MLHGVMPNDLGQVWSKIEPLISEACKTSNGEHTADDIKAMIICKEAQLWIWWQGAYEIKAVAVTTLSNFSPKCRACQILICTGDGRETWQDDLSIIEAWAKEKGCQKMKLLARKGWQRVLKTRGYDATHVVLEKAL